ncbi:PQQ-binding-like beta-propeller repeat protein [Polyangium mundeleinium]|uniref:PQQ-binding-like beta-propeller repeat protein n=1 Tax=Polyangium mundeleinium TaxID=2995306 RepID=A0ABT5F6M4_9BACT|nr:PQQ-binding-like beta-propeller repeat protein [Polyangium mundeleinium]MDC0749122.1 PQQ-binding-like beta-propeller repeat protein [Polyangium mundeleinium]
MRGKPGPLLASAAVATICSALAAGRAPLTLMTARATEHAILDPALRLAEAFPPPAPPPPPEVVVRGPPSRTFRGDAKRRHQSPFYGPRALPAASVLHEVAASIAAMPAILEGGDLLVASLGGALVRLSPTGDLRWKIQLGDRIYASPLVTGDHAILGSDADRVVAVRLSDGRIRWQLLVDGDADTAPAEAPDGSIVIAAGTSLYVIRPSGALRTRIRLQRKIYGSPAIDDDGTIYVGAQDDHLYAFTLAGARVFRRDLGADVDCAPLLGDDGAIFVGTDGGHVFAFEKSGALRFRVDVGGFVRGGLSLGRDGSVIAGVYGPRPGIVALDPTSGVERFAFRIREGGPRELGVHGGPLVDAEGRLYFGAADDHVYALDSRGSRLFSVLLGGDVDAPLVLGPGGVLYAGAEDGRLYAIQGAALPAPTRNGLW